MSSTATNKINARMLPVAHATHRVARTGNASTSATSTIPSSGNRSHSAGPSWSSWWGGNRANQTSAAPQAVINPEATRRTTGRRTVPVVGRWRSSHQVCRPNDSARSSSAAATIAVATGRGSTSVAAITSTTPWIAATTLFQYRNGAAARIHGQIQPAPASR